MSKLRAVAPDEKPTKRLTLTEAVEHGGRREQLVALRDRISKAIEDPNIRGADLAALSRRFQELAKDIEAIDAKDEDDDIGRAANTPDEEWATS